MAKLLEYLKKRTDENWLVGYNSHEFYDLTLKIYNNLSSTHSQSYKILICQQNKITFLAHFLAITAANFPVFLGNYEWKESEWEQVLNLVKPKIILGARPLPKSDNYDLNNSNSIFLPHIMIPTGGSWGTIKFAIHSWETLTASINAFQEYFNLKYINCCCILPVYHVSGLMQFLRCLIIGGKLAIYDYTSLKNNIYPEINPQDYFISLVPTQLKFLLENNPQWLAKFKTVLLGGAPPWSSLLTSAREGKINLALTYGMTETASGVVTLKPEDFLNGNNSTGQVLPHSQITITENSLIKIKSKSLCLGYYPDYFKNKQYFETDDLGYFDNKKYLHIIGRNSRKIISGGENIYPEEIEAAILATQLVNDVYVMGVKDEKWGEVAIAIYVRRNIDVSENIIIEKIQDKLSKYKIPKKWIAVTEISRNQQGKINLQLIKNMLV